MLKISHPNTTNGLVSNGRVVNSQPVCCSSIGLEYFLLLLFFYIEFHLNHFTELDTIYVFGMLISPAI
jgi:hypothetical protein